MNRNSPQRGRAERLPGRRSQSFLSPFEELFDPVRLFDDFFNRNLPLDMEGSPRFAPTVEVSESEKEYLVSVGLPGVKKQNINVDCSENMLTITAERKEEPQLNSRGSSRFYG